MDPSIDLKIHTNPDEPANTIYASLIGCLNYCTLFTRPNIAFATNRCTQLSSHPMTVHWDAARQIARYLLRTKDRGITYRRKGEGVVEHTNDLMGFMDADFAGDANDRKSTTGWVFKLNDSPISWSSKKQTCVLQSSMEAELIAGSFTSAEAVWLIKLGKDFEHHFTPVTIFTDNQLFIASAKSDVNNN